VYVLIATLCLIPISQTQGKITSQYGWRQLPGDLHRTFHWGIDIAADLGTALRAVQDGTVTFAYEDLLNGGGKMVSITTQLATGKQVIKYGHLHRIFVKRGDIVSRGQVIGLVGSTGFSTGPHLHLEILTILSSGDTTYHDPIGWVCAYDQDLQVPHFKTPIGWRMPWIIRGKRSERAE
jgi:murein DD-endopeptidase MepM/ murein hydrolase activator NlpD